MENNVNEADVVINRLNVALARSQKLINSWLPPRSETEHLTTETLDEDEEFRSMTEQGGIGSKAAYEDEGLPDGSFARKKLSSNDKLLEQILGKKAAQAKKKSQDVRKIVSPSKHAAPKSLTTRTKQHDTAEESDEDDEGGRATAFKSKNYPKRRTNATRKLPTGTSDMDPVDDAERDAIDTRRGAKDSTLPPDNRASKRKPPSYLDELLAQKTKGRKRKKHKLN